MKTEEVLCCSFEQWYPKMKKVTFRSNVLSLSQEFIDYLLADGLVLPKSTSVAGHAADDEDEDDVWDETE